ncbi:MAG: aldose 1-epimerase family protein [Ginsengibacter sp.]
MEDQAWTGKISNHAQLGGIETSIIDNGRGRGTRIAWVNTGTGLRYKIVLDRAMDIADAFYNQYSLAWLSQLGITPPEPFSDKGLDWLRTFGGGLLVTCGLSHVGGPEKDEFGERGLHGLISNLPATIESIIQPDPLSGRLEMSITGVIKQTQIFGPTLELKRTISGTLGTPQIRIHDEIINRGNLYAPHMLLYHCNFGWPLINEGTDIIWEGSCTLYDEGEVNKIFRRGNNFRKCIKPIDDHNGTGEEIGIIDINADSAGICKCGFYNPGLQLAVSLQFYKKQLPWLTNWQHWGKGEYVTGLEPGTNPPTGQSKAREKGDLIFIAPGDSRMYDLEIGVIHEEDKIQEFLHEIKNPN